jgi:hypothetical protein
MTIGPAPMIRIDLMSVRLGMAARWAFLRHSGAPRSGEPGIQKHSPSVPLDSGSGLTAVPE